MFHQPLAETGTQGSAMNELLLGALGEQVVDPEEGDDMFDQRLHE